MTNTQFLSGAVSAGEAVSSAWETLKSKYGTYIGISLIAMLLTGCVPCLNIFLMGPIMGGIYYVVLRDMRGEPVEFGMMFKGFEKFVPLMVIGLIQSVPGVIAQIVQYSVRIAELGMEGMGGSRSFYQISGSDFALSGGLIVLFIVLFVVFMLFSFAWWAVFFFAVPLVIEYDMGAGEAIKLSARAAMGNIGGLLLYFLLLIPIMLIGILMLCLGVFLISIPIMYIGQAFVYRMVFPDMRERFNMAPPPPTEYGFGGGQYA
jgi:hypothetical protein